MRSILLQEEQSKNVSCNFRLRIARRRLAPLALNEDENDVVGTGKRVVLRTSCSYHKLQQEKQPLKLSVLKLDGSLFDVQVGRSATVAELKQAVEELFASLPPKEGQGRISWSQVWSHFCLCYEGQKLINDKARLCYLGIKDGDQLQFDRHMSISYLPNSKSLSKIQSILPKPLLLLPPGSDMHQQATIDNIVNKENEEYASNSSNCEEEELQISKEFNFAHFWRGWLSYSRVSGASRKGSEGKSRPSRFSLQCLRGEARMVH